MGYCPQVFPVQRQQEQVLSASMLVPAVVAVLEEEEEVAILEEEEEVPSGGRSGMSPIPLKIVESSSPPGQKTFQMRSKVLKFFWFPSR